MFKVNSRLPKFIQSRFGFRSVFPDTSGQLCMVTWRSLPAPTDPRPPVDANRATHVSSVPASKRIGDIAPIEIHEAASFRIGDSLGAGDEIGVYRN